MFLESKMIIIIKTNYRDNMYPVKNGTLTYMLLAVHSYHCTNSIIVRVLI